jgi:hypothetical protein
VKLALSGKIKSVIPSSPPQKYGSHTNASSKSNNISNCIASSLKDFWVWSDTIASLIQICLVKVLVLLHLRNSGV